MSWYIESDENDIKNIETQDRNKKEVTIKISIYSKGNIF